MSDEVLVKVEHVSKKFCKDLKRSYLYGLQDIFHEVTGTKERELRLRKGEFLAVDDISFELRRGECLGLIGHNGAGKSTLLRILNGLIKPDTGKITMRGRIAALINLGAGFNPVLSGRENIYVNGTILGFTKKEIDEKYDAIVDFAEIGDFVDTPVQNYSSGMKVRLGFAVASQLEPDVLILDEVLAVGDVGFKIKCYNAISNMVNSCAVIFVSHSMPQIARIATHILLMHKGRPLYDGKKLDRGIEMYYDTFKSAEARIMGNSNFKVTNVSLLCSQTLAEKRSFSYGEEVNIEMTVCPPQNYKKSKVSIAFIDKDQKPVATIESDDLSFLSCREEKMTINIPGMLFSTGKYTLSIAFFDFRKGNRTLIVRHDHIAEFSMKSGLQLNYSAIRMRSKWRVQPKVTTL